MMPPGPVAGAEGRRRLLAAVLATLDDLSPRRLVAEALSDFSRRTPVTLIAIGKAALPMALGAADADLPVRDAVVVPPAGTSVPPGFPYPVRNGSHPLPDETSVAAAQAVCAAIDATPLDAPVLLLLSGGGSSLAEWPAEGIPIAELSDLNRALLRSGAPIVAVNTLRKHLSRIKGGRLAARAHPRPVHGFIVSDVPATHPGMVASGPTYADPTTFVDAIRVMRRLGLWGAFPAVRAHLERGLSRELPETPKPRDPALAATTNRVLLDRCFFSARLAGRLTGICPRVVVAEEDFDFSLDAALARLRRLRAQAAGTETLFILCGELTLAVVGDGLGGRNQELAGRFLPELRTGETLLAFATDGVDGVGEPAAAGGFCDGAARERIAALGLSADGYLERNDSYRLLDAIGAQVRTGPTGHNLGDLVLFVTACA